MKMTTAAEIVKEALREGNLIPLDTAVTAPQEAEGLGLLNRFLISLLGLELGEFAFDWTVPPSTTSPIPARFPLFPQRENLPSDVFPYPPGNSRILMHLVSNQTIFLDQSPDDGARMSFVNVGDASTFSLTVDANGRLAKGAATVTETPGVLSEQLWLYRADLGDWKLITTLLSTDESPIPALYDDLLIIGTHIRLAPRYGRSVSVESAASFKRLMRRLKAQYKQTVGEPAADPQPFPVSAADRHRTGFNFRSEFT